MQKRTYDIRTVVVAAVVSFAVAAPLSNAATDGVRSAVKVVKGKRGPRGLPGATGATGATGAQGAPGRLPRVIAVHASGSVPAGSVGVAVAACPHGTHVVSQGFILGDGTSIVGMVTNWQVTRSYAIARNPGPTDSTVYAQATCADVEVDIGN